ncbi:hypothetical protein CALCODRAFT_484720 [Calocera cornea HHB12733]|uniref:Rho-GAP domain-containing protein n=1 Tax=Calocera cornea HHB12733 TaxID=1353952 RepID=A0A165EUG6_9BASI|nr:hypothetical protein CALCODRAFT_484720 [Calocera cornea HHB12733]
MALAVATGMTILANLFGQRPTPLPPSGDLLDEPWIDILTSMELTVRRYQHVSGTSEGSDGLMLTLHDFAGRLLYYAHNTNVGRWFSDSMSSPFEGTNNRLSFTYMPLGSMSALYMSYRGNIVARIHLKPEQVCSFALLQDVTGGTLPQEFSICSDGATPKDPLPTFVPHVQTLPTLPAPALIVTWSTNPSPSSVAIQDVLSIAVVDTDQRILFHSTQSYLGYAVKTFYTNIDEPFDRVCLIFFSDTSTRKEQQVLVQGMANSVHFAKFTLKRDEEASTDVNVVSGTLKLWLRELPAPLFTHALHPAIHRWPAHPPR